MRDEIQAFKYKLRGYNFLCYEITTLENSLEFCYDRLGGVRGIDPSKEPTHAMPNKELEYKLRDDIERYEAKLKLKISEKVEIDQTLDRMETSLREAVFRVYAKGENCLKVSGDYYLSPSGLKKRMNKAISGALHEI